jgi:ABC-type oligopeptide transport system substrate-binding subunit
VSRVVHSLFKDNHMRKIILAAAVAGAALSLAACSKTEEAASSAVSEVTSADSAVEAVSADSAAPEAASTEAAK